MSSPHTATNGGLIVESLWHAILLSNGRCVYLVDVQACANVGLMYLHMVFEPAADYSECVVISVEYQGMSLVTCFPLVTIQNTLMFFDTHCGDWLVSM